MQRFLAVALVLGLAACEPTIPDSGAGVGFQDYDSYAQQQAARDAQLAGNPLRRGHIVAVHSNNQACIGRRDPSIERDWYTAMRLM